VAFEEDKDETEDDDENEDEDEEEEDDEGRESEGQLFLVAPSPEALESCELARRLPRDEAAEEAGATEEEDENTDDE